MDAILILPHQLFEIHPCLSSNKNALIILAEDPLFFGDEKYPALFHKQKLILHRASLKKYEAELKKKNYSTLYVDAQRLKKGAEDYQHFLKTLRISALKMVDPIDAIAEKRLRKVTENLSIPFNLFENPGFLNSRDEIDDYFNSKEHFAFTPFYIYQRKKLNILQSPTGKPLGGKWSFDSDNRKKAPKGFQFPSLPKIHSSPYIEEAIQYVNTHFSANYGNANSFAYPICHGQGRQWLNSFIEERLAKFGDYQDAIVDGELTLMHSVLSPALNIGLITPKDTMTAIFNFYNGFNIPLNSLEGFIRQIMGWREFVRGVYTASHVEQRTRNFWGHHRKLPHSFYTGTTGILPLDKTIHKILNHAYCHHIERLMVLGSFMLLCEFDPNEVYRWFMEMFIDSYDWVMVPNVYGMSQFADGGLMTTKPYICGSNYIRKMSNYPKGEWCEVWDALFWRFLHKHRQFFTTQARLSVLCIQLDKMGSQGLSRHQKIAENFLSTL